MPVDFNPQALGYDVKQERARQRRTSRLMRYLEDVLAIASGADSRHRCWQRGYDQCIMDDSARRARVTPFKEPKA